MLPSANDYTSHMQDAPLLNLPTNDFISLSAWNY